MNKRRPLIDKDGEVRELTAQDMRLLFKPAHEALPLDLHKTLGIRMRVPQKASPEVSTSRGEIFRNADGDLMLHPVHADWGATLLDALKGVDDPERGKPRPSGRGQERLMPKASLHCVLYM